MRSLGASCPQTDRCVGRRRRLRHSARGALRNPHGPQRASVEVLLQRVEGGEGRRDGRAEILFLHPKHLFIVNVRPLDSARTPADASLLVGLGLCGRGQGCRGREKARNQVPAVVDEAIAAGLEVIEATPLLWIRLPSVTRCSSRAPGVSKILKKSAMGRMHKKGRAQSAARSPCGHRFVGLGNGPPRPAPRSGSPRSAAGEGRPPMQAPRPLKIPRCKPPFAADLGAFARPSIRRRL